MTTSISVVPISRRNSGWPTKFIKRSQAIIACTVSLLESDKDGR